MPNTIPVVGTDGLVPIYNPDGVWQMWNISEVFLGQAGGSKYVPKVNDYVIDPPTFQTWIVQALDPVTLIPDLRVVRPANMSFTMSETDVLFGVGPGTQSDTYRAYLDQSTLPHILSVDARLKVAGTMCSYAKIFKGSDLNGSGHVVSKVYDSNGTFISENVPLELVAVDNITNYSIKTVSVCSTTESLADGETITAVFYSDRGVPVSKRQLLVENTNFIRTLNASQKYVSHISLESPFMSATFDNVIEYPLNIPMNALNLIGVVHYSDGSTLKLPVDGTKFTMHGLSGTVSNIIGQSVPLVLSYALSDGETAYAGVGVVGKTVTEPYSIEVINPNNSYTVKLFGYPTWIDDANGYSMRWWLLNLDRNISFEVTPYVKFDINNGPFNPKAYGVLQHKSVSINLRDVSGAFKPFVHTQIVDIVLNSPPTTDSTDWTMAHESVNGRPRYGQELFAKMLSVTSLNVSCNITTQEEWLDRVYKNTYPLLNTSVELVPLKPTHFILSYAGTDREYSISSWDQDLNITGTLAIAKLVTLKFIKRTSSGDLILGISGLILR